MDSVVNGFREADLNGKPHLVLDLVSSLTFFGEPATDPDDASNLPFQTLFLCPTARFNSIKKRVLAICYEGVPDDTTMVELDTSPHFHGIPHQNESWFDYYKRLDRYYNHPILPLFWCNNNARDYVDDCRLCRGQSKVATDYYFCDKCCKRFHKACVESPLRIKHPYHPKHAFQLCHLVNCFAYVNCIRCGERAGGMVYHCVICNISMHPGCAMEPVSFVIYQPKRHDHSLAFFTRKAFLDCNVCGLTNKVQPTYICLRCNFVAHSDCAYFPSVIRISRHHHRVSFVLSLPPREWSCGVCRKNVDSEYGAYTCNKCEDYATHSRCALRKDISDGKELEEVPEEDDILQDVEPYERIGDGKILHFSHGHHLGLETCRAYDEKKICQACMIPIYDGGFYSCMECDFILHDTCANAPRRKQHALHPHPLTLKIISGPYMELGHFRCNGCRLEGCGFIYKCDKDICSFQLDVRCASISEPFDYQGHEHPLFLALSPEEPQNCVACKPGNTHGHVLNCIKCDFIICFKCATLPYMARYKHDKHFLTLGFGDETSKPYWCEVCESKIPYSREERFYMCNHCCTTLHVKCLLGQYPYMKSSLTIRLLTGLMVQILPNYSFSRPRCEYCQRRCGGKIFFRVDEKVYCSMRHLPNMFRGISESSTP